MTPLGDPRRHYWLLQDMARATGVDLVRAFEEGRLGQNEWAETVERCRACGWAGGCRAWLASGVVDAAPPRPCRNRARFAILHLEEELAE
ncbi:DUF6455 family protein [Roseovarius salis]|uniref:DUF6455 family protein n=1 Tax=Roseovarius salis TaxID=3376063 RepID=UPI0037C9B1B0